VPLESVADVSEGPGIPEQNRENQKPVVAVTGHLQNRDLGSAVSEIQAKIRAQVTLPEGYSIQYGGLYEAQRQSFEALAIVFLLGIGLVLVVDTCQYEAFGEPIALFVSAALSLVGVVLALFITKTALNSSSFTGAIMNFGMVMTNGTVLMDYIRDRTARGMTLEEAVIDAGRTRIRPVLMTALIAILALLPLALGIGAGAEMQKPLAIAVIGGLAISPFYALLVGPVILLLIRGRRRRVRAPEHPVP
jgi:multidrug efflux pump subunit AcrB